MSEFNRAVSELYKEKENQIIIGLTGRTGAGCSTVASILKREFKDLELQYEKNNNESIKDKKEFEIIREYISVDYRWVPFEVIEGSCVILSYVFEQKRKDKNGVSLFIEYLRSLQITNRQNSAFRIDNFTELEEEINGLKYIFERTSECPLSEIDTWDKIPKENYDKYYNLYIKDFSEYKNRIKKILLKYSCYEEKKNKIQDEPPVKYHLYTYILQRIANNVRASGNPYNEKFCQEKVLDFAKRLEKLIELIKIHNGNKKTRICIDAIRNANESNYLKDVYRSYFLMSISVDEKMRRRRLGALDEEELKSLDYVEYEYKLDGEKIFYHQNIANCFEIADIHLVNMDEKNGRKLSITKQLVKYITLMIHPGLIVPNDIERCMQLAYNAKYSSGCLSRQVGAVVTDSDFAVKAIGWNDAPNKQLECIYRDVQEYCKGSEKECFSEYEYDNNVFKEIMENINRKLNNTNLHGRRFSYCFKDVYNGLTGERNQVYTRALHAEENAFLQISKYGGQRIKGGFLFCTASPCELCSKKAFQLGIKEIYYIDPYPGIAQSHILSFGDKKYNPGLHLFSGAIGEAYVRLYRPIMAIKDELELVSNINCKREARQTVNPAKIKTYSEELSYNLIEVTLEFIDRENIECVRNVDIEVTDGEYSMLERKITWTGSSYDKSELISNSDGYTLSETTDKVSPYNYKINFNKKINKGEIIKYGVKSYLKDESHLMHAYFAQTISCPTKKLVLNIVIPRKNPLIEDIKYIRYADMDMKTIYNDNYNKYEEKQEDEKIIYHLEIENPNLFYTYSLEWEFMKVKP